MRHLPCGYDAGGFEEWRKLLLNLHPMPPIGGIRAEISIPPMCRFACGCVVSDGANQVLRTAVPASLPYGLRCCQRVADGFCRGRTVRFIPRGNGNGGPALIPARTTDRVKGPADGCLVTYWQWRRGGGSIPSLGTNQL